MCDHDGDKLTPPDPKLKIEQIKLLYDYSKFHIGLYGTLLTALIAILKLGGEVREPYLTCLKAAIILLLVAAISGAVIASSITDTYQNYQVWEGDVTGFWKAKIGPYKFQWWTAEWWAVIEHTAFWLAVIGIVFTFLFGDLVGKLLHIKPAATP